MANRIAIHVGKDSAKKEHPLITELLSISRRKITVQRMVVRVIAGPAQGTRFRTEGKEFSIGSDRGNDFTIDDPSISGHHLSCIIKPNGVQLIDLESKNGIFLNSTQVERCTIVANTEVVIGRSTLRFETTGEVLEEVLSNADTFGPLVGTSSEMRGLFTKLQRIADSEISVLIQGETGAGKELVARALHDESIRKHRPFVVVDCGAISSQLVQSELFGHVQGSFTGAVSDRIGAFEAADGGTLFLDEVGELGMDLQPILLRALESKTITRIGENKSRSVKFRLVAATNRELRCETNHGRFRQDLYYRLSRLPILVPPLRERRSDIPALATLFARRFLADSSFHFDVALLKQWSRGRWPGNVRELKNAVERQLIAPMSLLLDKDTGSDEFDTSLSFRDAKELALRKWGQIYLSRVLEEHKGQMGIAAEAIGVDRNHLRWLLRRYQLE